MLTTLIIVFIIALIMTFCRGSKSSSQNFNNETFNPKLQSNTTKSQTEQSENNCEKDENPLQNEIKQTDFKDELNSNTKTKQQVLDEKQQKLKADMEKHAEYSIIQIKRLLLEKAQKGQYSSSNEYKTITIDYNEKYLYQNFLQQKHTNIYINHSILKPGGEYADQVYVNIKHDSGFDYYFQALKELAIYEDIYLTPFAMEDGQHICKYNFPFTAQGFCIFSFTLYIQCKITY